MANKALYEVCPDCGLPFTKDIPEPRQVDYDREFMCGSTILFLPKNEVQKDRSSICKIIRGLKEDNAKLEYILQFYNQLVDKFCSDFKTVENLGSVEGIEIPERILPPETTETHIITMPDNMPFPTFQERVMGNFIEEDD